MNSLFSSYPSWYSPQSRHWIDLAFDGILIYMQYYDYTITHTCLHFIDEYSFTFSDFSSLILHSFQYQMNLSVLIMNFRIIQRRPQDLRWRITLYFLIFAEISLKVPSFSIFHRPVMDVYFVPSNLYSATTSISYTELKKFLEQGNGKHSKMIPQISIICNAKQGNFVQRFC